MAVAISLVAVVYYVVADFKNEIRKNDSGVNISYEAVQELTTGLTIEADRERVIQVISKLKEQYQCPNVLTGNRVIGPGEKKYGNPPEPYPLKDKKYKKHGFVDAAVEKRKLETVLLMKAERMGIGSS